MENSTIGNKIKVLRKTRGMTQQQLAEKLGVQRPTISNYEIGRRSPRIKELKSIANILGVSIEYFDIEEEGVYNFISRAKILFENDEIPAHEKAKIYREIMKLYLKIEENEND